VVEHVQGTLYGTQRGALGSDLSDTVEELRARFGDAPEIAELMAPLQGTSDATLVRLTAAAILDKVDARHLMLALPALPPAYPPRDGARTLFHVTAFRDWARPCQDVVRAACSDDIEYRIGYEDLRPDILRAVWNDLCRASFVVADLTNLNPNAVLELGIAHALGRRTLVVSRSPDVPRHLPALANVRVHTYSTTPDGLGELARLVERFLASHRTGT
jgi:hypothetical protein